MHLELNNGEEVIHFSLWQLVEEDQWEPMLVLNSTPITPITHQPLQSRNYGVLKPDIFTDPQKGHKVDLLNLQVKKPKAKTRSVKASDPQVAPVDRSPSLHKISPLQQYILEQAKLSGYR